MENVPNFTDSDVKMLMDPLMPLVERSKGLQVVIHNVTLTDSLKIMGRFVAVH